MIILAILTLATLAQCQDVITVKNPDNITIAFGSCNNPYLPGEILTRSLQSVIQTQADIWIWGGDAIYLDGNTFFTGSLPGAGYDINDENYVRNMFSQMKANPTYQSLLKAMPVIGVWDDHDYAYDNADEEFPYKQRNMQIFLDFLDVPADSPRRKQQGVYSSYYIGDKSLIKVILLDVRYNRDHQGALSSFLDMDLSPSFNDMLGEEQWAWLDEQLGDPTPLYTLILSGTQYFPDDRPVLENWYQDSKERLFNLIVQHEKSGVVLISGDVHFAEMMKHPCPQKIGYKNFHEFTSSGLTHYTSLDEVVNWSFPDKYSQDRDRFFGLNFGVFRLIKSADKNDPPDLIFELRDGDGKIVLSRTVPHSDVVFRKDSVSEDCS